MVRAWSGRISGVEGGERGRCTRIVRRSGIAPALFSKPETRSLPSQKLTWTKCERRRWGGREEEDGKEEDVEREEVARDGGMEK